jgi:hypothetical protein
LKSNKKRDEGLRLLASKGLRRGVVAPPLVRWLWHAGFDVPPLPFGSFWGNSMLFGGLFVIPVAVMVEIVNWCDSQWSGWSMPIGSMIVMAAACAAVFGLSMASFHSHLRRKHALPLWKEFNPRP